MTSNFQSNGADHAVPIRNLKVPNAPSTSTMQPNDPLTFPPGVSALEFESFISRAREICGEENVTVISNVAQLSQEHYTDPSKVHDMHNIVEKEYFVASAVVCPRAVPDLQAMMRLCNEVEIPVWPFSVGRKYVLPSTTLIRI